MTTVQQPPPTESDTLLRRMLDTIVAFQALLIEEQQAIRSLSFGQFTMVTMRKSHLLDELRSLEQRRRTMPPNAGNHPFPPASQETELVLAIEQTDRLNRINGTLIGQSLEFLEGTLRLWQRSPASAALYSSSGTPVPDATHRVRTTG
ncbi:MAG: putative Flagellar chaperone FlgN [Nitrospira sp.]|nr:putative Flagellar chaperone FlgN [Nitrospira sp.]